MNLYKIAAINTATLSYSERLLSLANKSTTLTSQTGPGRGGGCENMTGDSAAELAATRAK